MLPVQLCVHQQLELRALCSIFHSLARLVVAQQQQQQSRQQEEQLPQLHPRRQPTATLPPPLLQRLLDATQQALLHTAAGPRQQVAEQQCPPQGDPQQLSQHPLPMQGHTRDCVQQQLQSLQQGDQQCLQGSLQTGQAVQQQHLQRAGPQHGQQQHAAEQHQWQSSEGLSAAGLNTLADALRLLRADPPAEWQAAYIAAAQQLMHGGDARNVPLMLAPLVRWRNPPRQSWLQQYMAACQSLMPLMQAQVRPSRVKQRVVAVSRASLPSRHVYCQAVCLSVPCVASNIQGVCSSELQRFVL